MEAAQCSTLLQDAVIATRPANSAGSFFLRVHGVALRRSDVFLRLQVFSGRSVRVGYMSLFKYTSVNLRSAGQRGDRENIRFIWIRMLTAGLFWAIFSVAHRVCFGVGFRSAFESRTANACVRTSRTQSLKLAMLILISNLAKLGGLFT